MNFISLKFVYDKNFSWQKNIDCNYYFYLHQKRESCVKYLNMIEKVKIK